MIATSNTMTAKIFAALAVAGLVASSVVAFAPAAGAQTTTTTTTTTSASVSFSRDLTIGSTGADVTALQNWLISKGFAIAAGATGYFGAQSQAALAKYQAANGISPAAGYFGPITRAKVNAGGSTSGGTGSGSGTGSTGGDLSGGETDLNSFELRSEDSSGDEGEEMVEFATAEFDVDDADARVERAELTFEATNTGLEQRPWQYFDTIYVMVDGDDVAEVDASDRDEWDETTDDVYVISLTGLDVVVDEGDTAELTFAADIADSIDTADQAQDFDIFVENEGIRAVDGEGIQQYTGDTSDTVNFGFGAEQSGDLEIKTSSEDPNSTTLIADADDESGDYTVFAFKIENDDDVDALITDITLDVATSSGDAIDDILDSAMLVADGDEYDGDINANGTIDFEDIDVEVAGDDMLEFELVVTLKGGAPVSTVQFSVANANVDAEGVDSGEQSDVTGSATGETHSVGETGINVTGNSDSASVNDDGTVGTFVIEFDVEALDEDVYIYRGADQSFAASTTGIVYNIYSGSTALAATTSDSASLQAGSDTEVSGDYLVVRSGDTGTITLTVFLDPAAGTSTAGYYVELDQVKFGDDATSGTFDDTTYTVPDEGEFETNAVSIEAS